MIFLELERLEILSMLYLESIVMKILKLYWRKWFKGYKFIEIRDINDGIPMQEEKEEHIFKEEPTRELLSKWEFKIWRNYLERI